MATRTKDQLEQAIDAMIVRNDTGAITPTVHRGILQDILDSSASGIAGSDVLDTIRWTGAGWAAVSDVQTQYMAITAAPSTYVDLFGREEDLNRCHA